MASLEQLLADLTSGDDVRAEAAVPALTVHGVEAITALLNLLHHPSIDHRWWAVRALAEFKDSSAQAGIRRALADPQASVAQCAALALKGHPSPDSLNSLLLALTRGDRLLSRLAADAMAALGQEAIETLARLAQHDDPQVRIEAVRALADVRHPDAVGPLFLALGDSSQMVIHWAERGLTRLGMEMAFFSP
jgi:HEAT repeat protein